jgi:hypothetical protein
MRERDEPKADQHLLHTASISKNADNAEAYAAFTSLPENVRLALLRSVYVLDGSSNIIDVKEEISRELYHAVGREKVDLLVERLEGWWFGVVIGALSGKGPISIPVLAIDKRIDELREEFKRSALPVDFASAAPPETIVSELDRRPFVTQLKRISVGTRRIEYAMRDYYRASEQRSRWAREDLLIDGELDNYERELIEAWQPRYAAMVDDLPVGCEAEEKIAAGQSLFRWVETDALFPLRSVNDRFLTHGSYHILANRYAVGWHPEYDENPKESEPDGED